MKYKKSLFLLAFFVMLMAYVPKAMSATIACTVISNQATVAYSVGGVSQTNINSNTATFTVANKINVVVTRQDGSAVSVAPGSSSKTLTFKVKNAGNYTQDYGVSFIAKGNGISNPFGGTLTDNFDATSVALSSNYINDLAPDSEVTITITGDIPSTQVNNDLAVYTLLVTTKAADGTDLPGHNVTGAVKDSLGATVCTTDFVYADTAGDSGDGDSANDAKASARSAYLVQSSMLTFDKTVATIWDPFNYNNSPKAIPGAIVKYTITISNDSTAGASAVLSSITDTLSANLTIDPDLKVASNNPLSDLDPENAAGKGFKVTHSSSRPSTPLSKYYTTANDSDGIDISGASITATMTTVLPVEGVYQAGELKPGESVTIQFNAFIN